MDAGLKHIYNGCMAEDRAAQKELYYRYFNLFMTICMRYLTSRADAEEVMNNAFLRIFNHIRKYNGQGSFEGWMKKIVVNCCLTFVGKVSNNISSRTIPIQDNLLPSEYAIELQLKNSAFGLDEKYQQEYLLQLLHLLPQTTRLVFNLYVFEEFTHQQIGIALDMAERTSQGHLAKARKMLATAFDKEKLIFKMQQL